MAKPVLYFALARGWHFGLRVLAVTSEKGRQVYGRELPSELTTHVAERDVIHRFPKDTTEAFAREAMSRAEAAQKAHRPAVDQARAAFDAAERAQRAAVLAAAKGEAR